MRSLRAIVYVAVSTLVAVAALPAHGAGLSTQKAAFASWVVPTDDPHRAVWFFAAGANDVHIGEDEYTFAIVGKGTCTRHVGPQQTQISCSGRSGTLSNDAGSFTMDAAAQEASIKVRRRGQTHTARWAAGDVRDDGFYTSEMACATGVGTGGGLFRQADATAHMFGRKLTKSRWFDFNVMMSGTFLDACQDMADLFTDLAAGSPIHLDFALR